MLFRQHDYSAFLLVFASGLALCSPARAQEPAAHALLDSLEVEHWADTYFRDRLAEGRFVAAAVAVVQGGRVVLARSYGYADNRRNILADVRTTRFYIGSLSKVFTGTALMTLVDAGKIQLDEPANEYLRRFRLPPPFGDRVTVRHLLTHAAGYEARRDGILVDEIPQLPLTGGAIERLIPAQVLQPGQVRSYSNFGVSVLGAIIEDVTGMAFNTFLARAVFEPLGMTNSGLQHEDAPAVGTVRAFTPQEDGPAQPVPFLPMHPFYAPSGGVFLTAVDMAEFMNAHLEPETAGSALMRPASFAEMQAVQAGRPESGIAIVFQLSRLNGWRTLSHGGAYINYHSHLKLLPKAGIGIFVVLAIDRQIVYFPSLLRHGPAPAVSSITASPPVSAFLAKFLAPHNDRNDRDAAPRSSHQQADVSRFVGVYIPVRRPYEHLTKFQGYLNPLRVSKAGDSGLLLGKDARLHLVGPNTFQRENSATTVEFLDGDDGEVRFMQIGGSAAFERATGLDNPQTLLRLLATCTLLLLSGLMTLFWKPQNMLEGFARTTSALVGPLTILLLLFPFSVLDSSFIGVLGPTELLEYVWVALAHVNLILLLGLLVLAVLGWRRKLWGADAKGGRRRAYATLWAAAGVPVMVILCKMHLIGF